MSGRRCLVIGEGDAAETRARQLAAAGARVERLARWPDPQRGEAALAGCVLAIGASVHAEDNRRLSVAAVALGLPVNVVDCAEQSTVIFPAIVDRGSVVAAVGTGARSPSLARHLKTRLELALPLTCGALAELIGEHREPLRQRVGDARGRRRFWQAVLDGPIAEHALAGRPERARELLVAAIAGVDPASGLGSSVDPSLDSSLGPGLGEVYLVGAGPGDPDLLTLAALRLMQRADVVLHDRLLDARLLDLARQEAPRICVGKTAAAPGMPQQDINRLLVERARAGERVLRLKGGDPFIFARGGEEVDALAAAGVPFRVVPGITAATACACCAGIPLTHRDHASSVRFLSGHPRDGQVSLPWSQLQREDETLVFYMAFGGLAIICRELVRHGRDPGTPAALVSRGTLPGQRVWASTLAELPGAVDAQTSPTPTILIVGAVVALRSAP